jgi:(p)ppGpp synthase/HD superfamily hydrolase
MSIERASIVARLAHKGQRYGEHDYYTYHVLGVYAAVSSRPDASYGMVEVALLHDVLEDSDLDEAELRTLFSGTVVDAVVALTRRPDEVYLDYIDRVRDNAWAAVVKEADLRFNLSHSEGTSRFKRYARALERLLSETCAS